MTTANKANWKVIGRGRAGWYADGGESQFGSASSVSSSGGMLEPYMYGSTQCAGYAAEAAEGALVYDASELRGDAAAQFAHLVIAGPMLDCHLAPYAYSAIGGASGELSPDYQITLAFLKGLGIGGLGQVGIGIKEALLRQIPGIRFGHVHAGVTVWE